ncbi:MAG: pilus assembly protein [Selenomonadaceae bacterium]|nr:pilus assembly protein [Selenomonadaceae bacterium]
MKQKGQGMVEFAVILPFLIFLTLSIIYTGAMFMDYIQYNNAARDAARDISLKQSKYSRTIVANNINNNADSYKEYAAPVTGLFTPTMHADFVDVDGNTVPEESAQDVKVTITLIPIEFNEPFKTFMFLPEIPIVYKMKIEK